MNMLSTFKTTFALVLLFFIVFAHSSNAQPTLQWAKGCGSTGSEYAYSLDVDAAGNSYVTGRFVGTVDFDPGVGVQNLTSVGAYDIFILKLDPLGNLLWVRRLGGADDDHGYGITVDANGNVITTGFFSGTVDFDPGVGVLNLTSAGGQDIFIEKLDASGNLLWAKTVGGASSDNGVSLTTDATGDVYVTGVYSGSVDFDPGAGTIIFSGIFDVFVLKLSAAGNLVWAKSMGGAGFDRGYNIQVDGSGNSYLTGTFHGTVDFDPGAPTFNLTAVGSNDIFVQKLDPMGNLSWAIGMGGSSYDQGLSVGLDATGNVYVAGYFATTVDFDAGVGVTNATSLGADDAFVVKLSNAGSFIWVRTAGGTSTEYALSLALDGLGNVYTTGQFANTVDFDPGVGTANKTSAGNLDVFVQKLDASGNFLSVTQFGSTSGDRGYSIAVLNNNYIYVAGPYSATVDFDPGIGTVNLTSGGVEDFFVVKLSQCSPTTSTISPTACNTYTAPGGQVYTTSGTYTATIPNSVGCDSIITINLTINTPPAQPGAISGNSVPCLGTTVTYSVAPVPGATTYSWTLPSGWSGSSTSNSVSASAGVTGGTITVTADNICGASTPQTLTVAVTPYPVAAFSSTTNLLVADFTDLSTGATSWAWDFGDGGTSTLTNPTHTYLAAGTYNVCLIATANGCADTLCQPITVIAVGVENTAGLKVSVFPNPSSGVFQLETGVALRGALMDVHGRVLFDRSFEAGKSLIDMDAYADGIYFLRLRDGDSQVCLRLAKVEE